MSTLRLYTSPEDEYVSGLVSQYVYKHKVWVLWDTYEQMVAISKEWYDYVYSKYISK